MNKRALFAIPLALLLSNGVQAQEWYAAMSYGMAAPISDTKAFTEGTSWRNFGFDVLARVKENRTIGLSLGWNVFDEVTTEVSSLEGIDIAGTQYRYINSFPMLVSIRQYMGTSGGARPFVGLGVGTQYVKMRVDVGQWRISDDTWHLAFAPEIGVLVPTGNMGLFLVAKYNYAVKASDRTHSNFGVNIGVAWQTGGF